MKAIFVTGGKQYYVSEGDTIYVEKLPNEVGTDVTFTDVLYVNGKDSVKLLAQKGICTSSGSACSSGLPQPSHVLLAMGLSEDIANSALRITLGKENTKEEIDYFVDELEKIVVNLRTERY